MSVQYIDGCLGLLLVWGSYTGLRRGCVQELFTLLSFCAVIMGSIQCMSTWAYLYGVGYRQVGSAIAYVIFVTTSLGIYTAINLANGIGRVFVTGYRWGYTDGLAGALLGLFRSALSISTFCWLADLLGIPLPKSYVTGTWLLPMIKPLAPTLIRWLSTEWPVLQGYLDCIQATLRRYPRPPVRT
ncbi:MAG: CvpA family protein [Bacteroidota bacterium]